MYMNDVLASCKWFATSTRKNRKMCIVENNNYAEMCMAERKYARICMVETAIAGICTVETAIAGICMVETAITGICTVETAYIENKNIRKGKQKIY